MNNFPNGAGVRPEIDDVPKDLNEDEMMKCEKCGCNDFYGDELYTWSVEINKTTKEVYYSHADSELRGVFCSNCNTEIEIPQTYLFNFN